MPASRRDFMKGLRSGPSPQSFLSPTSSLSGAAIAARGLEDYMAQAQQRGQKTPSLVPPGVTEIRISSNENPLGPGKVALDAILSQFPEAGRYPFNSTPGETNLVAALAAKFDTKPDNVVLGAGSQEILKNAVRAFTSPTRALLTASPTFENCTNVAKQLGHAVVEVKVDSSFKLDTDAMIAASKGAGLVFFNNPNNPTATVHGAKTVADFVERVRRISPDTVILIDEAYHDYVIDPAYQSAIPLALRAPNVFVSRTFSKAHGMAGLRVGYAIGQAETVKPLAQLKMPYNVSVFGIAAAMASLGDPKHIEDECARNTDVRTFTMKALDEMGCKPTDSQTNFLFVEVHRTAKDFREACAKSGVTVGRDFPPFEKTYARISLGTMAEMQKATDVFRSVLRAAPSPTVAGKQR